ncbi:crotonase/enoyl-CoA hydratase family protein [Luteimonas aquatica]|uniref:crotonase/enoyl-CoA hydratase family protein n=1 Tax=Luteimonas aquatica TaxID=450364 RepID=UPI001F56AC83|nr:crotonase/enoyl-CoA hydratase family protein [Luteimonas aquatica]
MSERVHLEVSAGTARVTLARGERHNGVDLAMIREIGAVQRALARRRDVRAAVLCGEGPSFCAGLDFKGVLGDRRGAALGVLSLWLPWRNRFQQWSLGWRALPFPVVAAVHGSCFGAGLQLALGADLRVLAPQARLSFMEARWGLVPDMGGIALVRELLPIDRAKALVMSGRIVEAGEALRLGLATEVADDPLPRALELARELGAGSPDAVAAGKFLLQEAWRAPLSAALAMERRRQRMPIGRANQRIAMRRNLDRDGTPPAFGERRVDR